MKGGESRSHQDGIHINVLHFQILFQGDLKTLSPVDLFDPGIQMDLDVGVTGCLPNLFFHHAGAAATQRSAALQDSWAA